MIITPEDYAMQDVNVRNQIYRAALGEDHWLMGYDLKLITRFGRMISEGNAVRKEMYEDLDEEAQALIAKQQYTSICPQPLGDDVVDGKTLHEKRLEGEDSFEAAKALEAAVKKHFDERVEQIVGG